MKRITVRIITYNQEDVIGRALDSVLQQKDWGLYRIVISDDCSRDRTWEVLQKYQKEYPDIVFPYRNEKNLGIYENVARADSLLPESDLYCELSGDDAYCDGYFKEVQELIEREKIDPNDAVGIYSDWKTVSPNGKGKVFKQDLAISGHDLWSLKSRGLITSRSLIVTKKVKDNCEPIKFECGLYLKEGHYDSQYSLNIKKAYYIPMVTSLYYIGIGVSTRLSNMQSPYYTTEAIECWNYYLNHYIKNKRDYYNAKSIIYRSEFILNPSWSKFFKTIYYKEIGKLSIEKKGLRKRVILYLKMLHFWISK